jgi:hypothetical protein
MAIIILVAANKTNRVPETYFSFRANVALETQDCTTTIAFESLLGRPFFVVVVVVGHASFY